MGACVASKKISSHLGYLHLVADDFLNLLRHFLFDGRKEIKAVLYLERYMVSGAAYFSDGSFYTWVIIDDLHDDSPFL